MMLVKGIGCKESPATTTPLNCTRSLLRSDCENAWNEHTSRNPTTQQRAPKLWRRRKLRWIKVPTALKLRWIKAPTALKLRWTGVAFFIPAKVKFDFKSKRWEEGRLTGKGGK